MSTTDMTLKQNKTLPWLGMAVVLVGTVWLLHGQGRLWICSCGEVWLWAGDIWSSHNSQHLFDPYTFTHVLHGVVFYGLLAWGRPGLALPWRLWLATFVEASWEIVENSEFVIERYRETTMALGYNGDTIVNSLADIVVCGLGFMLARRLGFRRSLAFFVATELVLLIWIRDSLILNVIMLVYPIEAIKTWQVGG
jgi:hypothetical protein